MPAAAPGVSWEKRVLQSCFCSALADSTGSQDQPRTVTGMTASRFSSLLDSSTCQPRNWLREMEPTSCWWWYPWLSLALCASQLQWPRSNSGALSTPRFAKDSGDNDGQRSGGRERMCCYKDLKESAYVHWHFITGSGIAGRIIKFSCYFATIAKSSPQNVNDWR